MVFRLSLFLKYLSIRKNKFYMKKTLAITVFNEAGVLTRISTVFSSRGFNMESIAVGSTEKEGISRIIIVFPGDLQAIEQISKQLNKLKCHVVYVLFLKQFGTQFKNGKK